MLDESHEKPHDNILFQEYNNQFTEACSKADTNTMKNLLKDEYQLDITVRKALLEHKIMIITNFKSFKKSSSYFQECALSSNPVEAIKCLLTSTRLQLNNVVPTRVCLNN